MMRGWSAKADLDLKAKQMARAMVSERKQCAFSVIDRFVVEF